MEIRQATPADLKTIMHITQLAFENEALSDHQEHYLVERLTNSDDHIPELSRVAIINDKIIGHIMYSKITINQCDGLAMAPLSVHPDYQRQGVGKGLLHDTLNRIPMDVPVIILGHPEYYSKFGFIPASTYNITPPFEVPDEAFMIRASEMISAQHIKGTVNYSKAFY